jgi:hypothetical protein
MTVKSDPDRGIRFIVLLWALFDLRKTKDGSAGISININRGPPHGQFYNNKVGYYVMGGV